MSIFVQPERQNGASHGWPVSTRQRTTRHASSEFDSAASATQPYSPAYFADRQQFSALHSGWISRDDVYESRDLGFTVEEEGDEPQSRLSSHAPTGYLPRRSSRFMAWSQVAGAFFLTFNSWGPFLSFGVFQDYYQDTSLSHFAPSTISWIGTVQGFLLIVVGTVTGPLFDLGHMRGLLGAGTALIFLGFLVASEVRDYFGVFLSLSILLGLGSGCLFVPSVAIIAQWFTTSQRPLATSIAAAGGAFGGVVMPIIFKASSNAFGAGWAYKILGFIALTTLTIPFFLLQTRSVPNRDRTLRALLDLSAFSDLTFVFFSLALFFSFTGLYIPFYCTASYAKSNLGVTTTLTFGILSAMNTGALFGRSLPSLVAKYFGSVNILIFVTLTCSIIHFCWIPVHTLTGILTFGISYGFFAGAVVSLPMSAFTELWPNVHQAGRRFGLSYSFAGFGILVGSPIAGILMSRFGYRALQIFGGVFIMLGFLSITAARLTSRER